MLVTSNRSVAEWGGVFGDAVVATAMLDRLLPAQREPRDGNELIINRGSKLDGVRGQLDVA